MKSRWTTYLLAAVVFVVWGLVVKRIFFDAPERTDTSVVCNRRSERTVTTYETDTLRCDYPDPFRIERKMASGRKPKTVVKTARPIKRKREKVSLRYFGSVRSDRRLLHIVDVNNDRYELTIGECADGFALKSADADSLYFEKDGITYSLSRAV